MKEEPEKVFQYMDLLYFSMSSKAVEKLAEQLKMPDMAQKIHQFLEANANKEIFIQSTAESKSSHLS